MPAGRLAVDADGGIWVAVWGGGAVHRYGPAGELTEVIKVPAANVTCCAFGGPELRTLYITTAAGPGEFGGSMFAARPGPAFRFIPARDDRPGDEGGPHDMPTGRAVMMALVFTAPGELEMRDVPEPERADGEILVHVRAAGICGSELHGARHPGFRVPPLIMGHEFAGISDNGDRVLINPILSCGHCSLCGRGLRHLCADRALIGVHRPGGFAERVAVPAGAVRLLPDWLSWGEAAVVEARRQRRPCLESGPGRSWSPGGGARLRGHRPAVPAHGPGRRG